MLTGIKASIHRGYTGYDHLIDSGDENAAADAVAGKSFRSLSKAVDAAWRAFRANCDSRVATAHITVTCRTA